MNRNKKLIANAHAASKQAVARARRNRSAAVRDDESVGIGGCSGCGGSTCGTGRGSGAGDCGSGSACGPHVGKCYHQLAERCGARLTWASGADLAVAAGGVVTIRPTMNNADYFAPVFCRLTGRSAADPTVRIPWQLTAVSIGNTPQECSHVTAPVAATAVTGVSTESYDVFTVDGKATVQFPGIFVRWGIFSINSLSKTLVLNGFSYAGAAAAIDARAEIWGYCLDSIPCNWKKGEYPGDHNAPDKDMKEAA